MLTRLEEESKKLSILTPADWIEKHFYIPETLADPDLKGRIPLQQYQRDVLNEALGVDENGNFKYSVIVWSDCKKSAKSTIAGAVGLWMADTRPWVEGYFIANDIKQADSRSAKYARRAVSLSPYLRENFNNNKYRILHKYNGSFIEAIPVDPEGEAGANPDFLMWSELWGATDDAKARMWCYDEETEILTRRGWVNHMGLSNDDLIATVNPETHKIEWDCAREINRIHYKGKMHYYGGKKFSLCVTPNHRLYGIFSYNSKSNVYNHNGFMTSEELRKSGYRVYFPLTSPSGYESHNEESFYISETRYKEEIEIEWGDFCEFMGWYLSEGSVKRNRGIPYTIKITQDKNVNPDKWKRLEKLFEKIFGDGFRMSGRTMTEDFVVDNVSLAKYLNTFGNSHTKYIPDIIKDSPPHHLQRFLHAYCLGDGNKISSSSWDISTGSSQMADDLQEIALKLGYYATVLQAPSWKGTYRVRVSDGKEGYAKELDSRRGWKEIDYDGVVWCPSTKNGLVIVRRNGKPTVCGNSESTLSPTKFGKSFRWIETYAGFTEESETLYDLWTMGVKRGELLWPDKLYPVTGGPDGEVVDNTPLELYVNREARLLCFWNTQPRCPWQTAEYYASEESVLHPLEFLRMHRNQWVANTDTYIPMEWWYACEREVMPEVPKNHSFVISLDAAVTADCFGMMMVGRHPDKTNYPDDSILHKEWEWKPSDYGGKIDYIGTIEKPGPETVLRSFIMLKDKFKEWYLGYFLTWQAENPRHVAILNELLDNSDYNIVEVAYDPHQLHDMANRLGNKEQLAWFRPFPQGSGKHSRQISDSDLRDKIRMRRIWYKNKPLTTDHLQNADAKIDSEERRVRIIKRTEKLKVDLAVALSMADYEVFRLNL